MEIPKIPRTGLGLRDIFSQAYRAQPLRAEGRRELTPVESLLLRSQGVDLARQYLPRWLGGYSQRRMGDFDDRRGVNAELRDQTMRVGEYPADVQARQGIAAEGARRLAQAAGALTADATTQGGQNIWWFINAFQAASSAAGQQAMHGALGPNRLFRRPGIDGAPTGAPFSRSNYTVAATFPVVLAASAAAGNLFRQPGYAAILPEEGDRRESENPLMETALRAIGMSGKLLPYEDLVKERPDVSRGDYEAYKAYLYGSPMPVKFNPDGIHGAEINFIGKSIPLLTGVLPVAAGVAGGAIGLRMAGKRLARGTTRPDGTQTGNAFKELSTREYEVARLRGELNRPDIDPGAADVLQDLLQDAQAAYSQQLNKVEDALFLGAIGGSSVGLGVTAAGTQLLEQIRRAQELEAGRREQQAQQSQRQTELPPVA